MKLGKIVWNTERQTAKKTEKTENSKLKTGEMKTGTKCISICKLVFVFLKCVDVIVCE